MYFLPRAGNVDSQSTKKYEEKLKDKKSYEETQAKPNCFTTCSTLEEE